jgi:vacuolar protein sorting-associated protein 13A/C
VKLQDQSTEVAALALSTATFSAHVRGPSFQANARLGTLSFETGLESNDEEIFRKQLLSIDGSNFIDMSYEVFDRSAGDARKADSLLTLRSAPVKVNFLEVPLRKVFMLLVKFSHLKSLYDAASQVASQQGPNVSRMQFDILIQSPILTFPESTAFQGEELVLVLGQFVGTNNFEGEENRMDIALKGIRLSSYQRIDDRAKELNIMENVDINIGMKQSMVPNDTQPHNVVRCSPDKSSCYFLNSLRHRPTYRISTFHSLKNNIRC